MWKRTIWSVLAVVVATASVPVGCRANRSSELAQHDRGAHSEFYAWEKTPQGEYKQVKKNYFMNEELCKNVIGVLNDMSTTRPRTNWALSHTTSSTFECWPAKTDPNDYGKENSAYSDDPSVDSTSEPK